MLIGGHMVVDAPPATVGVRCYTEITMSVRSHGIAGRAVAGLNHIAGLGAEYISWNLLILDAA